MKILMVDKYFFIKGGAERYFFELKRVLEAKDHQVIPFSMKHPNNFTTSYDRFFVDNIEYSNGSLWRSVLNAPRAFGRMVYSLHARDRIRRLIETEKPDIAHLHMIDHQLSPSILHVLKDFDIPVIQTVHQYKLVCPNYRLYNPRTNGICEKCLDGHFYHPVVERCHKGSTVASAMVAFETFLHRRFRIYENNIDIFHVPSHFMGEKLLAAGVRKEKVRHLFYTLKLDEYEPQFEFQDYIIYLGRLAPEKGILTLIKAMAKTQQTRLLIIGGGPERDRLERYVMEHAVDNVEFVGERGGEELRSLVRNCRFMVVPSEWYDNSPLVIYEAFAYGKPVIGAKMGGISELIDDGQNGFHFRAGEVDELADKIAFLDSHPELIGEFGRRARAKAETVFSPEHHYQQICRWYDELLTVAI